MIEYLWNIKKEPVSVIKFFKRYKTLLPPVLISIFILIAVVILLPILSDSELTKALKSAGLTVFDISENQNRTIISIASGTDETEEENIVIARLAKDILQSFEGTNATIKILNNKKEEITEFSSSKEDEPFESLPLYMEESLLKFKITYALNNNVLKFNGIKITTYPQCESDNIENIPEGRTVNVSIVTENERLENDKAFVDNLFTDLNNQGACVYVYNVSYSDSDGNILMLTSKGISEKDEIIINNNDIDK